MHLLLLAMLISSITATPTTPAPPNHNSTKIPSRLCGVAPPTPALEQAHRKSRKALSARILASSSSTTTTTTITGSNNTTKYTIDTVFHIITTSTTPPNTISKSMIASQFAVLQSAYAASHISFRLTNVTHTTNNEWARDSASSTMKATLRQGSYATLNIYFQSNLSSPTTTTTTPASSSQQQQQLLLGYCTLPTNITYTPCPTCAPVTLPRSSYAQDGCSVHGSSMPSGSLRGYNRGKTAVHEVGHWFGLLHTFQGYSCAADAPGDFIDDTPPEAVETEGCPVGKKSCPDRVGVEDPIHNFMDYSVDECYESFTPQQMRRMHDVHADLRLGL